MTQQKETNVMGRESCVPRHEGRPHMMTSSRHSPEVYRVMSGGRKHLEI